MWQRYWNYMRPFRGRAMLVLLLALVTTVLSLAMPYAVKIVLDEVLLGRRLNLLAPVCLAVLVVVFLSTSIGILTNYMYARTTTGVLLNLRLDLARHFHRLRAEEYSHIRPGDFVSRFLNDIVALQTIVTDGLFGLVLNTLTLVALLTIMFLMDHRLGLVALASVPVFLIVSAVFSPSIRRATLRTQEQTATVTDAVQEMVEGVWVTRLFGQEKGREAFLHGVMTEHLRRLIYGGVLAHTASGAVTLVVTLAPLTVLAYGAHLVQVGGLSPGGLVAFLSYLSGFYGPVQSLSELAVTLQSAWAVLNRVDEVFNWPLQTWPGTQTLEACRGEVCVSDLTFSYGTEALLEGVSLTAPAGEAVLITGPSGIGKSTLASVIAGLYSPQQGCITLDGIDIRDLSRDTLTRWIAVVPQDVFLFNDTIEANIRFGEVSRPLPEVISAADRAGAHKFIVQMPEGYQSVVGTHGSRLSGGQKQRIALARALLRRPAVLILDEATTSVDAGEEMRIQEALKSTLGSCTLIIITHRPEAYPWASRTYVLEDGTSAAETRVTG